MTNPKYYIGHVLKPDPRRRVPSVEMRFLDDSDRQHYWFPLEDVRAWVESMVRRGSFARFNPCSQLPGSCAAVTHEAGEVARQPASGGGAVAEVRAAAEVLQSMSVSLSAEGGQRHPQPTISDGRVGGSVSGGNAKAPRQRHSERARSGASDGGSADSPPPAAAV